MRPKTHPESLALIIAEYRRDALRREREARWWPRMVEPASARLADLRHAPGPPPFSATKVTPPASSARA